MTAASVTAPTGDSPTDQLAVAGQQPTAAASETLHWPTLLIVLTGVFMTALDVFIVNVAIPSTQHDLHASDGAVQWIVAGFGLAVAAGVITAGRLGDLYGRRRMFSLGLGLFTLASAACGLAPTTGTLIAARVFQGAAAALLTPQVLAILGTAFAGKALTKAFTAYGLAMGLAAISGQLIGGLLIHANLFGLGWRACFLINVPVGAAAVLLVPRVIPLVNGGSARSRRSELDVTGMVLVTAALVAIVLPLIQGRQQGWPWWTAASFLAGAALLTEFARYERRLVRNGREPLIDPALFADRAFSSGMAVQLIAWTGQASFFLVFAVYLQEGVALSPLSSGVLFIAIGVGYVLTASSAGAVAARLGRQTVALGAAIMIVGLLLLDIGVGRICAGQSHGSTLWLVPGLIVDGAGMGLIIAPMTSLVLARVAPHHAGAASGVLSMVMQLGGALGVALIGILFYGALAHPARKASATFGHAFTQGSFLLIAIAAAVMVGIQLLPKRAAAS
ncbi:MAG: major facilitator superfamily 1 [Mycobacterium sp.]|nr:major facilitator superfamily 1 [Mycobacterium sp.]